MNVSLFRIISCLLAVIIISGTVSCSPSGVNDENTESGREESKSDSVKPDSTGETEWLSDNLGNEWNFNGHTFKTLTGTHGTYLVSTFSVEESSGEVMNDALFDRNLALSERFNISFAETVLPDIFNVNDMVKQVVLAGDKEYDMFMQIDRYAIISAINGYLLDYSELPRLDLSREYWYQGLIEDLSVNKSLFYAAGYDNLVYTTSITHLVFNQNLLDSHNLENPFELVRNGKWTTDKFFEMAEATTIDLNGDGKWTDTDGYGVVTTNNMFWPNFWIADGVKLVDKNEEGYLYFKAVGYEKFYNVCQDLANRTYGKNTVFLIGKKPLTSYTTSDSTYGSNYNLAMAMFMGGNVLFCGASLITILDARGMEDDFGIIPYPRTDEVDPGTPYYSRTFGGFPYVVPSNINDEEKERTSVIMEALACSSYNIVKPALFDTVFRGKVSRNPDSVEMLEGIIENRVTDLGETYFFDTIESVFESMFYNDEASQVASKVQSLEKSVNKILEKYNDAFRILEEKKNS